VSSRGGQGRPGCLWRGTGGQSREAGQPGNGRRDGQVGSWSRLVLSWWPAGPDPRRWRPAFRGRCR